MNNIPIVALLLSAGLSGCADANSDSRTSREETSSSEDLPAAFGPAEGDQDGLLDSREFGMAEQLIAGWRGAHGEANVGISGGDGHGNHSH